MVIRLDAKPRSAAVPPAAAAQQKYQAATAQQVRESRDHIQPSNITDGNPSSGVVVATTHNTSTVSSSTPSVAESSSSSSWSNVDDFVRAAVNVDGSKGARRQQPANAPTVTRQRFVKKATGTRDVELRQASPSSGRSSGTGVKRSSCDKDHGAILRRSVLQPTDSDQGKQDSSGAAVRTSNPGYNAASSDFGSHTDVVSVTEADRSVADRIASFEQLPITSDSSLSLSSVGVRPTSSGTRRKTPPSSEDGRSAATGSLGERKFTPNTSAGSVAPTSVKSTSASPSPPPGQIEQEDHADDEDQGFDNTRL